MTKHEKGNLKKISQNTWASDMDPEQLLNTLARSLSESHEVLYVDRKNLTILTNWDKFLIQDKLFRNKIHIILFPVRENYTEVVIRNDVEYHSAVQYEKDHTIDIWIPTQDITKDVQTLYTKSKQALHENY